MKDQRFLDLVRKFVWDYLLWCDREGRFVSFEKMNNMVAGDIHHALQGDYFNGLGPDFKERKRVALGILNSHEAEVKGLIEELFLQMDRKKFKESIHRTSAKAVLEPLLDEMGVEYYIEYLKNGVKINVRLLPKKKAQLYMSYSKVRKESDNLIYWISEFKRMYGYFGVNSGIVNISNVEQEMFAK